MRCRTCTIYCTGMSVFRESGIYMTRFKRYLLISDSKKQNHILFLNCSVFGMSWWCHFIIGNTHKEGEVSNVIPSTKKYSQNGHEDTLFQGQHFCSNSAAIQKWETKPSESSLLISLCMDSKKAFSRNRDSYPIRLRNRKAAQEKSVKKQRKGKNENQSCVKLGCKGMYGSSKPFLWLWFTSQMFLWLLGLKKAKTPSETMPNPTYFCRFKVKTMQTHRIPPTIINQPEFAKMFFSVVHNLFH